MAGRVCILIQSLIEEFGLRLNLLSGSVLLCLTYRNSAVCLVISVSRISIELLLSSLLCTPCMNFNSFRPRSSMHCVLHSIQDDQCLYLGMYEAR